MPSKEGTCTRIFKKYGFMIDGDEDLLSNTDQFPDIDGNETFKQWKEKVFGNNADINVYALHEPKPQTRISTLVKSGGGEHLTNTFLRYRKLKERKLKKAVAETKSSTIERYSTFSKETLVSLLDDLGNSIEPSVKEFVGRYLDSTQENIDAETLLKDLLISYNKVVIAERNSRA